MTHTRTDGGADPSRGLRRPPRVARAQDVMPTRSGIRTRTCADATRTDDACGGAR